MAVVREVHEESGVTADMASVQYVSSQPWPFPQSLMLGFRAEASPPPNAAARLQDILQQLQVHTPTLQRNQKKYHMAVA